MDEKTVSIELNANEAQVLVNLLNIACQAKGLEAAESCTHFSNKIQKAVQALQPPVPSAAPVEVEANEEEGTAH